MKGFSEGLEVVSRSFKGATWKFQKSFKGIQRNFGRNSGSASGFQGGFQKSFKAFREFHVASRGFRKVCGYFPKHSRSFQNNSRDYWDIRCFQGCFKAFQYVLGYG